jgi:hypothetical protein
VLAPDGGDDGPADGGAGASGLGVERLIVCTTSGGEPLRVRRPGVPGPVERSSVIGRRSGSEDGSDIAGRG